MPTKGERSSYTRISLVHCSGKQTGLFTYMIV